MKLPHRVVVVGSTGSGKTCLAQKLAKLLGVAHVELDAIYWGPDWTRPRPDDFMARTLAALQTDGWVVDGYRREIQELVWKQADTVVWLNYPLPVVMKQLFLRTLKRVTRREVLWNGNTESWRKQFLSRHSLFVWAVRHTYRYRRAYRRFLQDPQRRHLQVIELRSWCQTHDWLDRLSKQHRGLLEVE